MWPMAPVPAGSAKRPAFCPETIDTITVPNEGLNRAHASLRQTDPKPSFLLSVCQQQPPYSLWSSFSLNLTESSLGDVSQLRVTGPTTGLAWRRQAFRPMNGEFCLRKREESGALHRQEEVCWLCPAKLHLGERGTRYRKIIFRQLVYVREKEWIPLRKGSRRKVSLILEVIP